MVVKFKANRSNVKLTKRHKAQAQKSVSVITGRMITLCWNIVFRNAAVKFILYVASFKPLTDGRRTTRFGATVTHGTEIAVLRSKGQINKRLRIYFSFIVYRLPSMW